MKMSVVRVMKLSPRAAHRDGEDEGLKFRLPSPCEERNNFFFFFFFKWQLLSLSLPTVHVS